MVRPVLLPEGSQLSLPTAFVCKPQMLGDDLAGQGRQLLSSSAAIFFGLRFGAIAKSPG